MKKIIYLSLLLILASCNKEYTEPTFELPLVNKLTSTTGFVVKLDADVYPSYAGKTYFINLYSSNKVSVDYKVTVRWYHTTGRVYQYAAVMPNGFVSWTTSTLVYIDYPLVVLDKPEIVSVNCSDTRYKFSW